MPQSKSVIEYFRLCMELYKLRQRPFLPEEEDAILDKMDVVWWNLTDAEITDINQGVGPGWPNL